MPRARQIKITKDDQEGYCLKESLPAWERLGWTAADDGSSEQPAGAQPAANPQAAPPQAQTNKEG